MAKSGYSVKAVTSGNILTVKSRTAMLTSMKSFNKTQKADGSISVQHAEVRRLHRAVLLKHQKQTAFKTVQKRKAFLSTFQCPLQRKKLLLMKCFKVSLKIPRVIPKTPKFQSKRVRVRK